MFADEIPNPFRTHTHTYIHPASKKIVKMIEKGSLEMKSRTRSENESTRGADVLKV